MSTFWARFSDFWCRFAHEGMLWPIHGVYRCRQCLRVRTVPWSGVGNLTNILKVS